MEAIPSLASIGRFSQLPGVPASALRFHGPQYTSDLPNRERGVPVDVLEVDRFFSGLLEGSVKLVNSPAVLVFRPVSSPRVRPQGQRCARVGTISPLIVERDVDLVKHIGLPLESIGTSWALRKRTAAPLFGSTRLANNYVLGFFLENGHITDDSRRV